MTTTKTTQTAATAKTTQAPKTLRTATIRTEPFTCPSCITKIEGAVGAMPGVQDVRVMFNSGKAKVVFDEAVVSGEQIAATIDALGYRVTSTRVSS